MIDIDALAYVAAAYQGPRPGGTIPNLIVLHSGETNEGDTAAEGMANYFASGATVGSAHICVDNDSAVRCAPDENRTNGAGGVNNFALHLEQAGRAGQLAEEWADPYSSAVVANAAEVVRGWVGKFPHIRPVFLDAAALAGGERDGITTHNEVSQVFAGNDGHWDPGPNYPLQALLDRVTGAATPPRKDSRMLPGLYVDASGAVWVYDPNTKTKTWVTGPAELSAIQTLWSVAALEGKPHGDPTIIRNGTTDALLSAAVVNNAPPAGGGSIDLSGFTISGTFTGAATPNN